MASGDRTSRSAWNAEAMEQAARLELAEDIRGSGLWTWEPASGRLSASPRFRALLGLEQGTELTLRHALEAMPAADAKRVGTLAEEVVAGRLDAADVTYRLLGTDGRTRWMSSHWIALRHSDGAVAKVVGVTTDDTERVQAAESLREASAFWQATLDSLTAQVAVLDEQGSIIAVNRAWREFSRGHCGEGDYLGVDYLSVCEAAGDSQSRKIAAGLRHILAGEREIGEWTYGCHGPDERRWFVARATRFTGAGQVRVVVAHEDVTVRHLAEAEAQMRAELLDEVDAAVIVCDTQRRILAWSDGAARLYGYEQHETLGRVTSDLLLPGSPSLSPAADELLKKGSWEGEMQLQRKDGSLVEAYFRMRVVCDEEGRPERLVGVSLDVSEQKRTRRELQRTHDYMRAVADSMSEAMFTVDSEGRAVYLNPAAERLLGWSAEEAAGKQMHTLSHWQHADGSPFPVAECPIVAARVGGETVRVEDDVFTRKDGTTLPVRYTASPFSTEDGVDGCVVLLEDISQRKREEERVAGDRDKLLWLRRVREALADESFELYAQPIVATSTGETAHTELLLRMHHRELPRPATPGCFLPVAEELGVIREIDRWVVARAAQTAAAIGSVAVNLSARSIGDRGMIGCIEQAISSAGIEPRLLVFELTETALLEDESAAKKLVEQLHRLGCRVALDDFGTGYGTFTYLKQLPIDLLKIDIEFIRDLSENRSSQKVVHAVVNLAREFGLQTVAEGVENEATVVLLRELGVDFLQGFHLGRPAPLGGDTRAQGPPVRPAPAHARAPRAPRRRRTAALPRGGNQS